MHQVNLKPWQHLLELLFALNPLTLWALKFTSAFKNYLHYLRRPLLLWAWPFYNIQGKHHWDKRKKNKTALSSNFKLSYEKAFKQADTLMRYKVCRFIYFKSPSINSHYSFWLLQGSQGIWKNTNIWFHLSFKL